MRSSLGIRVSGCGRLQEILEYVFYDFLAIPLDSAVELSAFMKDGTSITVQRATKIEIVAGSSAGLPQVTNLDEILTAVNSGQVINRITPPCSEPQGSSSLRWPFSV